MSEETHPGEVQTSVGTPDYMEKARELADSYPQLLARKQEVSVILLDEIEAGLDKESQELIGQIEKELLQEREHFIIVKISHGEVANLECYNKVIELN